MEMYSADNVNKLSSYETEGLPSDFFVDEYAIGKSFVAAYPTPTNDVLIVIIITHTFNYIRTLLFVTNIKNLRKKITITGVLMV